jgi:hypothetical protein
LNEFHEELDNMADLCGIAREGLAACSELLIAALRYAKKTLESGHSESPRTNAHAVGSIVSRLA